MIYKQVIYNHGIRGGGVRLQLAYQRTPSGGYAIAAAGVIGRASVKFVVTGGTERDAEVQLRSAVNGTRESARPRGGQAHGPGPGPGSASGSAKPRGRRRRAKAPGGKSGAVGMSEFDLAVHARDLALLEIDVDQPVTEERIKSARRAAAAKHHPDAGGSAERMVEINNAHDTLVAALRRRLE